MIEHSGNGIPPEPTASAENYSSVIESRLHGDGEGALQRAYEIGRAALTGGAGLLDLARMHHGCVMALLSRAASAQERGAILSGAAEVFAECISPFEMTYRGFRDANVALRGFNDVLEREAQRVAHSLHDEAGQLLVAVYLELTNLAHDVPQAAAGVTKVTELLDKIEVELRRLSHELTPAILDDFGLVPALKYLVDGVSQRSGMKIAIEDAPAERFARPVETVLYRVAQESLTNAARHAHATEVTIRFDRWPAAISCRIRDNGVGFEARRGDPSPDRQGYGLIGIRERAGSLGGTLQVDSTVGAGTEVIVSIPVEK